MRPSKTSTSTAPSIISVQTGQHTFMGDYVRQGCPPTLPAEYKFSHRVVQKHDGSWCFLPLIYDAIPESWYSTRENRNAPIECQSPEAAPKVSETADHKPALRRAEVITGSQACTEMYRSDHPIPNDPPISSGKPGPSAEEIMNDFEADIANYLICSPHQRTVLALWILHTYCPIVSATTPYLNIYSPVEQSGKSTCLGLLRAFCAQPWFASGAPASTLTRKIIADQPTVLLDNWHATFRGNDRHHITGFLLNSCEHFQPFSLFERGSVREVQVYCPKAFAGMAALPPTLAQRSIPIVLQRRLPHEDVTPVYWLLDPKTTSVFTSWAKQWAKDHLLEIDRNTSQLEPHKSLSALSPHQQACCQPLMGIAETLGGEWPAKAGKALLEIFREEQAREASAVQLLSDVYDAFASHNNTQRIFTNELLDYLHSLDHRPWHEWNKGQPMTAHTLSSLLRKHFNIYSRSQRRDKQKRRGYQQSDFIDAWQRYLPALNTKHDAEDALGNAAARPKAEAKAGGKESASSDVGFPDFQLPNYQVTQLPNAIRPAKSSLVSMSQFKAKSHSILKRLAGKAVGLFVATRK